MKPDFSGHIPRKSDVLRLKTPMQSALCSFLLHILFPRYTFPIILWLLFSSTAIISSVEHLTNIRTNHLNHSSDIFLKSIVRFPQSSCFLFPFRNSTFLYVFFSILLPIYPVIFHKLLLISSFHNLYPDFPETAGISYCFLRLYSYHSIAYKSYFS